MSDLWPLVKAFATPAESQLQEPGLQAHRVDNCVYATTSVQLQCVLGAADTEPEDLRSAVDPQGLNAGGDYAAVAAYLKAHKTDRWPNLPELWVGNPYDTKAAIMRTLDAGYLAAIDLKDVNGVIVADWPNHTGWTHSVLLVGHNAGFVAIWNPWNGDLQYVPWATVVLASLNPAGTFLVFQKDIRPAIVTPPPSPAPPPAVLPPVPPAVISSVDPKDAEIKHLQNIVDQDTLTLITQRAQIADLQQQVNHLQAELQRLTSVAGSPTTIAPEPWWVGGLAWLRRMLGS